MVEKKGVAKKRGRKPTKKPKIPKGKRVGKKRGRKPKGGKIVMKEVPKENQIIKKPNIILHLKCSSKELKQIQNNKFNMILSSESLFNTSKSQGTHYNEYSLQLKLPNGINREMDTDDKNIDKDIWKKLNYLKYKLHINDVSDKRSNCFWCTYPFDNPPIYIPKQERNGIIEVYGCFCSPECAVAYLKKEPIDSSILWERYAMLNNIYSGIYDYTANIKPAPDPYHTLDKYYGNLTIDEYRKLLNNQSLLLVVDKPLTKILPELYEENNDIPSIYTDLLNQTNKNRNKPFRLSRKKPKTSKKTILHTNFNLG